MNTNTPPATKRTSGSPRGATGSSVSGLRMCSACPSMSVNVYAREVIAADLEMPGDEDVIRKVLADFEKRGVALGREDLVKKLNVFAAEARSQLQSS